MTDYEFNELSLDERKALYGSAVTRLKEKQIIEDIASHIKQTHNSKLLLCEFKSDNRDCAIQFLIEGDSTFDLFQLSGVISFIKEKLDEYPNVIVQPTAFFSEDGARALFLKKIPYVPANEKEIGELLDSALFRVGSSPQLSHFFASSKGQSSGNASNTVLSEALRLMELAVADDPKNLEKIVEKAKELGSPKSGLDKF